MNCHPSKGRVRAGDLTRALMAVLQQPSQDVAGPSRIRADLPAVATVTTARPVDPAAAISSIDALLVEEQLPVVTLVSSEDSGLIAKRQRTRGILFLMILACL